MIRTAGLLTVAAFAAALLIPMSGAAQNSGKAEAAEMVPAQAALDRTIDADNAKPGQAFQAKLANKIELKNGQELPRGTTLMGKVGQDDMHESGKAKLALCIDEAKLKDGKTILLKATITGVYGPQTGDADTAGYNVNAGDQEPNGWNHNITQVDQIGALSGVDLHSKIFSQNSGVLVSTTKSDIKLKTGTELALAVGPANRSQSLNNAPAGSER